MNIKLLVYCFTLFAWVVLGLLGSSSSASANELCDGNQATLTCLKVNFHEVYRTNTNRFWDIIYSSEKKALNCHSIPDTADFLEIAREIKGNAEVSEYFSETIEMKLFPSNLECFLDALIMTTNESQNIIIGYLRRPLFSDQAKIRY